MAMATVLAAFALVAAPSAHAAPPANDDLAAAQLISTFGVDSGTTAEATREPLEPEHNSFDEGHSVWYRWEPAAGTYLLSTCDSAFDTVLAVYTGPAAATQADLAHVATNDDSSGACGLGDESSLSVTATAGQIFYIAIDGHRQGASVANGAFTLHVGQPVNDAFALATTIAASPAVLTGTTLGASRQPGEPAHGGVPNGSIWWKWTPGTSGTTRITTCGSSFDTLLGVYTEPAEGAGVGGLTLVTANDLGDECDTQRAAVNLNYNAGTTYFIAVDGAAGSEGSVVLRFGAPANDRLASALTLTDESPSTTGSNIAANLQSGEPDHDGAGGTFNDASVWYSWTPVRSGTAVFDTCSSGFDTVLAVYTGTLSSIGALVNVGRNDDAGAGCANANRSKLSIAVTGGTAYRVAVASKGVGAGAVTGSIALHIEGPADVTAPDTTITAGPAQGSTTAATTPTFSFTSTEVGSTFQCRYDAEAFASCTSPATRALALGDGPHTFEVKATDPSGNEDATPATRSFTVDTQGPDTTAITSAPPAFTNQTQATIVFSGAGAASFQCKLDGAAFGACTTANSHTVSGLGQGSHTLHVRGLDAVGNPDPTPATATFTVDTAPPDTSFAAAPALQSRSTTATFDLSATEAPVAYTCTLDGNPVACTDPVTFTSLGQGSHTFTAFATDPAGNFDGTPASLTWSIDSIAPDTGFAATPPALTNSNSHPFDFSATEGGATFACKLDAGAYGPCTDPLTLTNLADGSHTLLVKATDGFGNEDPTEASFTWTVDRTGPVATIAGGPTGITGNNDPSFTLGSNEPGSVFQCKLDTEADFTPCTSPKAYTDVADGARTLQVKATDPAGNLQLVATTRSFTVDTTLPVVTIGPQKPADPTSQTVATAAFSATDATAVTFECKFDGDAFQPCTSPKASNALGEGPHTFTVQATDAGGNVGTGFYTWTIDLTAPNTLISSPLNGAITGNTTVSVLFDTVGAETGDTFQCRLDGGVFTDCASPKVYSAVADGTHTVEVVGTDAAGNVDPTPAGTTFSVDTIAPDTAIVQKPVNPTNATIADFTFTATDLTSTTFECKLDGGAFAPCTDATGPGGSHGYTGLADGSHTFQVRATDAGSLVDASPATYTWVVDTVAPDTGFAAGGTPPALANSRTAAFNFTSTEAGSTFQCKLDTDAGFTACTDPVTLSNVAEGNRSLQVRSTDPAGNTDPTTAVFTWTIDVTDPTTVMSAPVPVGFRATPNANITFFSPSDGNASFECQLDTGLFVGCTSPKSYTGLADGPHSISVRSVDSAGNADETPATTTFTVDTGMPNTSIVSGPRPVERLSPAVFDLSGTDAISATANLTYECKLDGGAFAACPDPASFPASGDPALSEGSHTVEVRAKDQAGNLDPSPATFTWTVDTIAPSVTLTSQPQPLSNNTSPSVSFTANEAGSVFQCKLDNEVDWTSCGPGTKTYTGVTLNGVHQISVRAQDPAGNTGGHSTATFTIDTAPPNLVTTGPAPFIKVQTGTVTFTSSDNPAPAVLCKVDAGSFAACSGSGQHTVGGLSEGPHTITVQATDTAGNLTTSPRSFTVDLTAPVAPNLTGAPAPGNPTHRTSTTSPSFTFDTGGTGIEPGATFVCRLDAAAAGSEENCTSPWQYTGRTDGSYTFNVWMIDAAGNRSAAATTWSFIVDTVAPVTSVSSWKWNDATVSPAVERDVPNTTNFLVESKAITASSFGTNEPGTGSSFECLLDGVVTPNCLTPFTWSNLNEGIHTIGVRAKDVAGNVDASPEQRVVRIDTVAPNTTLTSGPAALHNSAIAEFRADAVDVNPATLQCSLDGENFSACTSPKSYTALPDGSHTVRIRAVDIAGNEDATPVTVTFRVDTTTPETAILDGPAGSTPASTASFLFATNEPSSVFECRIDSQAFRTCTERTEFTGLADGTHTVQVRAKDAAGNVDTTPASRTWTIAPVAPPQVIVEPPPVDETAKRLEAQKARARTALGEDAALLPLGLPEAVAVFQRNSVTDGIVDVTNLETKLFVVFCSGCEVTATPELALDGVSKKVKLAANYRIKLPSRKVKIAAGEPLTVRLRLTKTERNVSAKAKTAKVNFVLTIKDAAGKVTKAKQSYRLKVKLPKAKKKRRR